MTVPMAENDYGTEKSILVVEDSAADFHLIKHYIEIASAPGNISFHHASSLDDAIEVLRTQRIDIITLDLGLPDSSGINTYHKLHEHSINIPMVILSGVEDNALALQAVSEGAEDFLCKNNLNEITLTKMLNYALSRFRLRSLEKRQLEEVSELKSQFLAAMSHEIRTPMNAILGMTDILLTMQQNEEQMECLRAIRASGGTLMHLLNDLLDFTKFNSDKIELELRPVQVEELLEEVGELFSAQAQAKKLLLLESIDPEVPDAMVVDAHRLKQILSNLLSNAIKFTESGHVKLSAKVPPPGLSTKKGKDDPISIVFEVADTGPGIHREDRGKLFEVFFQGKTTSAKAAGGTGLGLAISKKLTDLMGGRISLQSGTNPEERGSKFSVELPVCIYKEKEVKKTVYGLAKNALVFSRNPTLSGHIKSFLGQWVFDHAGNHKIQSVITESLDAFKALLSAPSGIKFDFVILSSLDKKELDELKDEASKIASSGIPILWMLSKEDHLDSSASCHIIRFPFHPSKFRQHLISIVERRETPIGKVAHARPELLESYLRFDLPILVIEDNEYNQLLIKKMLSKMNLKFQIVGDSKSAMNAVNLSKFSVILMDCSLPDQDGWKLTEDMRRIGIDTPIIALTAHVYQGVEARCQRAGMDGYLSKPITIAALRQKLSGISTGQVAVELRSAFP